MLSGRNAVAVPAGWAPAGPGSRIPVQTQNHRAFDSPAVVGRARAHPWTNIEQTL